MLVACTRSRGTFVPPIAANECLRVAVSLLVANYDAAEIQTKTHVTRYKLLQQHG